MAVENIVRKGEIACNKQFLLFSQCFLLSHITIVETMNSGGRGMNPVIMTIINPQIKYTPSQGSDQQPPVLKSCTLPTELWYSADMPFNSFTHNPVYYDPEKKAFENNVGKGENAGNQHFLLFSHFFSTYPITNFKF